MRWTFQLWFELPDERDVGETAPSRRPQPSEKAIEDALHKDVRWNVDRLRIFQPVGKSDPPTSVLVLVSAEGDTMSEVGEIVREGVYDLVTARAPGARMTRIQGIRRFP